MPGRGLVVLTYHTVRNDDAAHFERQMRWLKRETRPVFADATMVEAGGASVAVTFDDAFQSVVDCALPILDRHAIPATIFVPTGYMGSSASWISSPSARDYVGPVASADQLRALDPSRVRLGSHTVTHPRLGGLTEASLDEELSDSKAVLEAMTGTRITMLALPYGSYSLNVVAAAVRAGYNRVFANVPVGPRRDGVDVIFGRVDVSPRDWPIEFHLKVYGAYGWMGLAVPAKREVLKVLGRAQEV